MTQPSHDQTPPLSGKLIATLSVVGAVVLAAGVFLVTSLSIGELDQPAAPAEVEAEAEAAQAEPDEDSNSEATDNDAPAAEEPDDDEPDEPAPAED